jgi:hypothetical protein
LKKMGDATSLSGTNNLPVTAGINSQIMLKDYPWHYRVYNVALHGMLSLLSSTDTVTVRDVGRSRAY